MIKINSKIYLDRLQLFLKDDSKTIGIIADTHIGYIRLLNKKGIHIIDNQVNDIIKELKETNKKKLDIFIINGDFFHEFSKLDNKVTQAAEKIINLIKKEIAKELIIIKGNHDIMLNHIIKDTKILDYYETSNFFITHGDKYYDTNKTLIIGHEHPAVKLENKTRSEEYKTFLIKEKIIILPSFNLLLAGHNILEEKFLSPFLKRENNFQIIISENGKLFDFQTQLNNENI
ncbi:metallophosphoesterase [Candidatus Woesearchaeota archaeon]|nr:metallophosphoesterase [Candidatus Woesearchaeota archaeon]